MLGLAFLIGLAVGSCFGFVVFAVMAIGPRQNAEVAAYGHGLRVGLASRATVDETGPTSTPREAA